MKRKQYIDFWKKNKQKKKSEFAWILEDSKAIGECKTITNEIDREKYSYIKLSDKKLVSMCIYKLKDKRERK